MQVLTLFCEAVRNTHILDDIDLMSEKAQSSSDIDYIQAKRNCLSNIISGLKKLDDCVVKGAEVVDGRPYAKVDLPSPRAA